MTDYERIARVIRYLDEHHTEQPNLATLAGCIRLSTFHFHRLFSAWAGITPNDFLQCLTLAHAKALLREGESVLNAALATGLSGPGRLHDLCVSLEAASPGEWKSRGERWTIRAGVAESPFGKCLIGVGPRGVCHLSFLEPERDGEPLAALKRDWPGAKLQRDNAGAENLTQLIFKPPPHPHGRVRIRAYVRGTAFQVRVWRALLQVPLGTLVSYSQLAAAVGDPAAARAVGRAVGENPLGFVIPCHRVIRQTGIVGQYHWGPVRKRAMLVWESVRRNSQ